MRQRSVVRIMEFLRERNRYLRANNLKINEWVDRYIGSCVNEGQVVNMLTQWCISKNLEFRRQTQGGSLVATKKERGLFEVEIPRIAKAFQSNGITLNWWITFNRAFLDSRRVNPEIEAEYQSIIGELARPLIEEGWLIILDWEKEVLGGRPQPDPQVLNSVSSFVKPEALELELRWNSDWAKEETNLSQSRGELMRDVCFQIACEAEEGRYLTTSAPFGEFILVPLEVPEQYEFFTIFAPDFKKRIVAVLPQYPWRLKGNR